MSVPEPRRPVPERRLAANRATAHTCTGPKTPAGETRARPTALVHGPVVPAFALLAVPVRALRRALSALRLARLGRRIEPVAKPISAPPNPRLHTPSRPAP